MAEALTDALEQVEGEAPKQEPTPEQKEEYLNNLVGEDKKYKTADDLAKAYHHANMHIDELKSDLDEYKGGKELLNEVLDEIRSSSTEESVETPAPPKATVEPRIQTDDVAKIVGEEFSKREQAATVANNVGVSMDKLRELYGSDTNVKVAVTKAINGDDNIKRVIDDLSKTSPDSMVKFITGIAPVDQIPQSNTPGVDASAAPPVAFEGDLTWAKCRELRKENPKLYNSPQFRLQIEAAANKAAERGIDFFAN
jgi:predicted regulator of amino acid metabolism with ACT domain